MKEVMKESNSVAARVEAYQKKTAGHDRANKTLEAAKAACARCGGGRVVIITGPTGVGKSTVARSLFKWLRDEHAPCSPTDRDLVRVVGMSAVPPTGRFFSWKDFYIRMLFKARDPLTDKRLLASPQSDLWTDALQDSPADRMVAEKLRRAAETTLKRRSTGWLIVDEAHHMFLHPDRLINEIQFESLKSLAAESQTIIVLVGTYKLLDIRDQSGQLIRRSDIVHFSRYDLRDESDKFHFRGALRKFQVDLDLPQKSDLLKDFDRYMVRSTGCVGILKEWLDRAYEAALTENRPMIDLEFALQHALQVDSLMTIAKEALAGERRLRDAAEQDLLGLLLQDPDAEEDETSPRPGAEGGAPGATDTPPATPRPAKRPAKTVGVGVRKPVRDPVGRHHVGS